MSISSAKTELPKKCSKAEWLKVMDTMHFRLRGRPCAEILAAQSQHRSSRSNRHQSRWPRGLISRSHRCAVLDYELWPDVDSRRPCQAGACCNWRGYGATLPSLESDPRERIFVSGQIDAESSTTAHVACRPSPGHRSFEPILAASPENLRSKAAPTVDGQIDLEHRIPTTVFSTIFSG